jgi:endonuclease YncB( thermonuclease family)
LAPRPRLTSCNPAYGRTLAYVYLDTNGHGEYEHLHNEDLIELGMARTTAFSRAYRREFERVRERAELRGTGLWAVCPEVSGY